MARQRESGDFPLSRWPSQLVISPRAPSPTAMLVLRRESSLR